jgi:hypothetical protein
VGEISDAVPLGYGLEQNYPNPFNPTTTIAYAVAEAGSQQAGAANVRLIVYDLLGREVAMLVNERKAPGRYTVQFTAEGCSSGTYLYSLEVGGTRLVRKMVLTR